MINLELNKNEYAGIYKNLSSTHACVDMTNEKLNNRKGQQHFTNYTTAFTFLL